jgi:hypothetical protein
MDVSRCWIGRRVSIPVENRMGGVMRRRPARARVARLGKLNVKGVGFVKRRQGS